MPRARPKPARSAAPPAARALITAFLGSEGVTWAETLAETRKAGRLRARLWQALRGELEPDGHHTWTVEEIASWFGVWHSAVSNALGRLDRKLTKGS